MHLNTLLVCQPELATQLTDAALQCRDHRLVLMATIASTTEAPSVIRELNPDVVILDPSLDNGRLLLQWKELFGAFPILVCASSDEHYGVEAFEAGAAHYVRTSALPESLASALGRAAVRSLRYDRGNGNGSSAREWQAPFKCNVIALPHATGIEIRSREEVVSAHGEGNYTRIVLQDDPPMLMSKPIGEFEEALMDAGLVRVHRSHMVNVDHIRRVRRGKSPVVQLSNGAEIDVSETYREMLFRYLQIHSGRRHDRD
jgi:two-component system LytT family response regulator